MARKKLNDLAKIGLGLAAAYGASKVLGSSPEQQSAINQMEPYGTPPTDAQRMANQAVEEDASRAAFARTPLAGDRMYTDYPESSFAGKNSGDTYGSSSATTPKGSVDAFRADEAARRARIEALRSQPNDRKMALSAFDEKARAYNRSMMGAKKGKMIKASTGGSVVARGNKIARSKPTKLY